MKQDVFGTKVCGAAHVRTGKECQDSIKKVFLDNGAVILAAADGHGSSSCPFSKSGSVIAVNVFCSIISGICVSYENDHNRLMTYLNREGSTSVAKAIETEWKRRVLKVHSNRKREVPLTDDVRKDKNQIYKQYGTTLLGLLVVSEMIFAFQLGDGDISYVEESGSSPVMDCDKILGVETHSLSRKNAWEKAVTSVRYIHHDAPYMFMLSTDGFSNSFKNDAEFRRSCSEYYQTIYKCGISAVSRNLKGWLNETSQLGCGDDISVLIAYFG